MTAHIMRATTRSFGTKSFVTSLLLFLATIILTSVSFAQNPPPLRVRGTIEKVDGQTLMVKARDGTQYTVKLADNPRITAIVKATLADIKSRILHRRHCHAATGRQPEGDRPSHLSWTTSAASCRRASRPGT